MHSQYPGYQAERLYEALVFVHGRVWFRTITVKHFMQEYEDGIRGQADERAVEAFDGRL